MAGKDILEHESNFTVTVDFPPNAQNPSRLLQAAASYIEALQSIDKLLTCPMPINIETAFELKEVKYGSIIIKLKQILLVTDDDAIKNLDWKPQVGNYLVGAKYILLKKLEEYEKIPPKKILVQLCEDIMVSAKKVSLSFFPKHRRITPEEIAQHTEKLSNAAQMLCEEECIKFSTAQGVAILRSNFLVTPESILEIFTERTTNNQLTTFYTVKKPEFLSKAKWEFKSQNRTISAAIKDEEWLENYQNGDIDIRPGDSLHITVNEVASFNERMEVLCENRDILKVIDVIKQRKEGVLFDDE